MLARDAVDLGALVDVSVEPEYGGFGDAGGRRAVERQRRVLIHFQFNRLLLVKVPQRCNI